MKDVKVIAPKAATFTCDISPGEPAAMVHWYKDGRELKPSRKYNVSYEGDHATLTINDTELVDGATYRCEAINRLGSVESEAKLTVHGTQTCTPTAGMCRNRCPRR